eukprot:TRINITY_DN5913_c0_g1_i4.p1 TRINITY_DN5913_c0_g1~~TRINITY_DN5913_c0_g1_i4.p1  ORF type:complete len:846 (+),score=211.06 TRINITY_DN5913_c0_g1_i4:587-3124(+)
MKEIRDLGAIPLLVDLLRSSHLCVQKAAAAALYNISLFSEDRVTIKNVGGVGILLDLLSSADLETQEQAITTLVNLARNEDIRDEIRIKGGVKLIMEMISNKETPDPVKIGAIRAARCLTFSEANRELIVKLNGLETLLDIISSDYTNDEVVSNAVGVISNLCVYEENRLRVKSKGGIDVIIKLLSSTSEKTQEECASALLNVSFTREIKDEIREKGGIIKLLDLLRHSSFNVVKLASCSALFNLSISDENKSCIVENDGVRILIENLTSEFDELSKSACGALHNIAILPEHRRTIVRCGAIGRLIKLFKRGNDALSEYSASVLTSLAESDQSIVKSMILSGQAIPYLYKFMRTITYNDETLATAEHVQAFISQLREDESNNDHAVALAYAHIDNIWNLFNAAIICRESLPPDIKSLIIQLLDSVLKYYSHDEDDDTKKAVENGADSSSMTSTTSTTMKTTEQRDIQNELDDVILLEKNFTLSTETKNFACIVPFIMLSLDCIFWKELEDLVSQQDIDPTDLWPVKFDYNPQNVQLDEEEENKNKINKNDDKNNIQKEENSNNNNNNADDNNNNNNNDGGNNNVNNSEIDMITDTDMNTTNEATQKQEKLTVSVPNITSEPVVETTMVDEDDEIELIVQGESIRCNKKPMMEKSYYFKCLLATDKWKEGSMKSITLHEAEYKIIEKITKYCCLGTLYLESPDEAIQLIHAAIQYMIPLLATRVGNYLQLSVNAENFKEMMYIADITSNETMKLYLIYYFLHNWDEFYVSKSEVVNQDDAGVAKTNDDEDDQPVPKKKVSSSLWEHVLVPKYLKMLKKAADLLYQSSMLSSSSSSTTTMSTPVPTT